MSILQVTNIRSNSGTFDDSVNFLTSGGTENGRLVKAWVNFNGQGAVAIRNNFNVNTIGDNGEGDFTLNFANALGNATYAISGCGSRVDGNQQCSICAPKNADIGTGSFRFVVLNDGTTQRDPQYGMLTVFSN